ncbi:MAG: hypothetical protein M1580_01895 [Candidatus Parvarchaeota archaeon]|nr:hypothetical protein [Candidatus Parvarchaeota archaeon]
MFVTSNLEVSGELTASINEIIKKFRKPNAKFLGRTTIFSFFYTNRRDSPDFRVRVTNGKSELVLKYRQNEAFLNRKEITIPIPNKNLSDAIEMLRLLGWISGVISADDLYKFRYKGVKFTLVDTGMVTYFKAEKQMKDKGKLTEERNCIIKLCKELGMKPFNGDEFYNLINKMAISKERQFNFNEERFEDIENKFKRYFYVSRGEKEAKVKITS